MEANSDYSDSEEKIAFSITVFTGDTSTDKFITDVLQANIEYNGIEWNTLFYIIWSTIEVHGFKKEHIDQLKTTMQDIRNGCLGVMTNGLLNLHLKLSCTDPVDTGSAFQRQELIDVAKGDARREVGNENSQQFYKKWREYAIRELKIIKLEDAEIEVWIEPITDQVMTFDSTLQTGSYI